MKKWVKQWLGPSGQEPEQTGNSFPWVSLDQPDQLAEITQDSAPGLRVVFKHSTRCGLSTMMLRRFEHVWQETGPEATFYLLDLIRYRELSDALAKQAHLPHQSPQVLILRGGKLIGSASHGDISGLRPADFRN